MSGVGSSSSVGGGYPRYLRDLYRKLGLKDKDGDRVIEDSRVWDSDEGDMVRHDGGEGYQISYDLNNDGIINEAEAKYHIQTGKVALFGVYDEHDRYDSSLKKKFALTDANKATLARGFVTMLQKTRLRGPAKITVYDDISYAFRIARETGLRTSEIAAEAIKLIRSIDSPDTRRPCIITLAEALAQDTGMSAASKELRYRDLLLLAKNITDRSGNHDYRSEARAIIVLVRSMHIRDVNAQLGAEAIWAGLSAAYRIDNDGSKVSMIEEYKQLMRSLGFSNDLIDKVCTKIEDEITY